jgi:hypothetical protein
MKKMMKWKFNFKFSHSYSWIFIMGKLRSQKIADIEVNILKTLIILSLKEFSNTNQAVKHFNISPIILGRWFAGGKSITESRESAQLLSISEGTALAQCITRLTASGLPIAHDLYKKRRKKSGNNDFTVLTNCSFNILYMNQSISNELNALYNIILIG